MLYFKYVQVEYPYEWLEVKLEVGQGGADPLAENAAYFTHFLQTKALTNRMLPGLTIEQFGCFLRWVPYIISQRCFPQDLACMHGINSRHIHAFLTGTCGLCAHGIRHCECGGECGT